MKLYYAPGTCALGIHILLEEIGKPFELHRLDFAKREQYSPDFMAVNPKSRVPALLRDDGSLLTELPAIAWYLARSNPQAKLLPTDIEGETRTLEIMDYMVATLHMRGFSRIFRPENFAPSPDDHDRVRQVGRETVEAGFTLIAAQLRGKDFLLGQYSIADMTLFFLEYWASHRAGMALAPELDAHLKRMLARPAVQRTLAAEGLA